MTPRQQSRVIQKKCLYKNGGPITYTTSKNGEAVEFHAQWQKNEPTVQNLSSASVSGIQTSYIWTGSEITPVPTVSMGSKVLTEGTDYDLLYEHNTKIGTASVTITGTGKYTGSVTKNFSIQPRNISYAQVSQIERSYSWTGQPYEIHPILTYDSRTLIEGTDYTLAYANNVNIGTASIIITGIGNYNDTMTTTFVIEPLDISGASVELLDQSCSWTGSAVTPAVRVLCCGRYLTEGTDYTVSYRNNINAGIANIVITGTGNYTGSKTIPFNIVKPAESENDIREAEISGIEDGYPWNGSSVRPRPEVRMGANLLRENVDYYLDYYNDDCIGLAQMVITGMGSYTGSLIVYYQIDGKDLSAAEVLNVDEYYSWTGYVICPRPQVRLNGIVLRENLDYQVFYDNNIEPGIAEVQIRGIGDYSGTIEAEFTILETDEAENEQCEMHRLYNPNSGEHFYTADENEKDYLKQIGWKYEGVGWIAPAESNTPVYRLYNGNTNPGDHHYTTNAQEKDYLRSIGWQYEGIGWYSDDLQGETLYREYNPNTGGKAGSHNYTSDLNEHSFLTSNGWRDEGVAWYGIARY